MKITSVADGIQFDPELVNNSIDKMPLTWNNSDGLWKADGRIIQLLESVSVDLSSNNHTLTSLNSLIKITASVGYKNIKLPDATTLINGIVSIFQNTTTQSVGIRNKSNNEITFIPPFSELKIYLNDSSTIDGDWNFTVNSLNKKINSLSVDVSSLNILLDKTLPEIIYITNSSSYYLKFPNATSLINNTKCMIYNLSNNLVEIKADSTTISTLYPQSNCEYILFDNSTPAGQWLQNNHLINKNIPSLNVDNSVNSYALTKKSPNLIYITNTSPSTSINLPDATTLPTNCEFSIYNNTNTFSLLKTYPGTSMLTILSPNSITKVSLFDKTTTTGVWKTSQDFINNVINSLSVDLSTSNVVLDRLIPSIIYITTSSSTYYLKLPSATTLPLNKELKIINLGSVNAIIKTDNGVTLTTISPQSTLSLLLQNNTTTAGIWIYYSSIHSIAQGIVNLSISSQTSAVITSTSWTAIPSFSITPSMTGVYLILFNGSVKYSKNGESHQFTIRVNGVEEVNSTRTNYSGAPNQVMVDSTMLIKTISILQPITVALKVVSGSSATVTNRSLIMIRIGN